MSLSLVQVVVAIVGLAAVAFGVKQAFLSKKTVTNPSPGGVGDANNVTSVTPPLKGPGSNTPKGTQP